MNELMKCLIREKKKLEAIANEANMLLKSEYAEGGKIRVMLQHNTFQFYLKDLDENCYKYLKSCESERGIKIVKHNYYEKILKSATKGEKLIGNVLRYLEKESVEGIPDKMGKIKKSLIEPLMVSDEEFVKNWISEEYEGKAFDDEEIEIYTEKGERVRSKSEKIIADKFYKEGILYRYEYPLTLRSGITIYPDFTVLDMERRRHIIYEHFGMMDDEIYASNAVGKVQLYATNGYHLGDNLYVTMETGTKPFDSRTMDGLIERLKR